MDAVLREEIVAKLGAAFGGARDVTPAAGQPLHVLLEPLDLPSDWTPSTTRALTVWEGWPNNRPAFYIDQSVRGPDGQPPRNPSPTYLVGETWNSFSFQFPWSGDDPVLAVQRWLTRFDKERPS
jgi:hypothetical protein